MNHLADQRPILPDSLIDRMTKIEAPDAMGAAYGLGWFIHDNDHGYRLIEHTGGMPGVSTALNLYPTENLVITVLSNDSRTDTEKIAGAIAGTMLPKYAAAVAAERAARKPDTTTAKFVPPAELVGTWSGTLRTWERTISMELTVRPDGDVQVQLGPPPRSDLELYLGGALRAEVNLVRWNNGILSGRFAGTIPTPDVMLRPHTVGLELALKDGLLRGRANAETGFDPVYYSLASYVELRRR